jgi:DNA-binding IclR family transcriptional regulator
VIRPDVAGPGLTRSLQRGLLVLEAIAASNGDRGVGTTQLAAAAGIDKATAIRMAQTLCALGYIYQDGQTKRYRLAGKLLAMAAMYRSSLDLPQRAARHLAALHSQTGETVHLGVRELNSIVYVAKLDSPRPVQIASAVGQTMPLHTTALGKAILADMPDEQLARLLPSLDLAPRTERSITEARALLAEIDRTRTRGYSIDDRENEDAIVCVGASVSNAIGEVLGAISVSGPAYRMADKLEEYGPLVRGAADGLGGDL